MQKTTQLLLAVLFYTRSISKRKAIHERNLECDLEGLKAFEVPLLSAFSIYWLVKVSNYFFLHKYMIPYFLQTIGSVQLPFILQILFRPVCNLSPVRGTFEERELLDYDQNT